MKSGSRGFKAHSGQFSVATFKNNSVVNTICINSFRHNVGTCATHPWIQLEWLNEEKTEMKREHWINRWDWSCCTNLAPRASWAHGLVARLVRVSERNSVVVDSKPTQANFLLLLLKILQWIISYVSIHSTTTWLPVWDFASSKCGDWRKQIPKWNVNNEQRDKIRELYKVGSENELNSGPDSSVG